MKPDAKHGAGIWIPTKISHSERDHVGKYSIHGESGFINNRLGPARVWLHNNKETICQHRINRKTHGNARIIMVHANNL